MRRPRMNDGSIDRVGEVLGIFAVSALICIVLVMLYNQPKGWDTHCQEQHWENN